MARIWPSALPAAAMDTCFRTEALDSGRGHWISLYRARLEKMVILGG